jgi:hypothetical protein
MKYWIPFLICSGNALNAIGRSSLAGIRFAIAGTIHAKERNT